MIRIRKFTFQDKELTNISNAIRTKVFVEEQQVSRELEYENEEESYYYLFYYDEIPVATARWRETDKGIKLERFAMLKNYRNRKLGTKLLKEVIKDVLPLKKRVYLHSQIKAVSYYERAGFVKKGNVFVEAGIQHYLMEHKGL